VTLRPWQRLTNPERVTIEAEALALPIPGVAGRIAIAWEDAG